MLKDIKKSYRRIANLGEGSSGEVCLYQKLQQKYEQIDHNKEKQFQKQIIEFKPKCKKNIYFALKKLKRIDQIQDLYTVPQINIMHKLKHPNLMSFSQIVYDDKGYQINKYLVMDYGIQIINIIKQKQLKITTINIKQIIKQIIQGLHQMHKNKIIHRDVKPQNIYAFPNGQVRLGDFSISRDMNNNNQPLTSNMVTRCYRPPEIMFGSKNYSYSVDIWSLGCTIAQFFLGKHLFPGKTDLQQLQLIFQLLGTPEKDWPKAQQLPYYLEFTIEEQPKGLEHILPKEDQDLFDLIKWMITLNPQKRPTTQQILKHKYFDDVDMNLKDLARICSYLYQKKLSRYI